MELLLIVAGLVVAVVVWAKRKSGAPASSAAPAKPSRKQRTVPASLPVKTRRYFFSRAEKIFYDQLLLALKQSDYVVFPKPRLDDIFEPSGAKLTTAERNRLSNKHIDYLIVTRKGFHPALGIELDGSSHNTSRQQHNDRVKAMIFRSANLPLVRFKNDEQATAPAIRARLAEHLRL